MGGTGEVFVNIAIDTAINNYFKYKNQPDLLVFNTFDVVVARIIVWLYGELDITNCVKTKNEHGMGGFDMNICKFGYPAKELEIFKENFLNYYNINEKNKVVAIKEKNPYMDLVQKNLIDMFFYKKVMMNLGIQETKEFYDFLFTIKSNDYYKQSYAILMSNDPYDVVYYFNLKMFRLDNKYTFSLYKLDVLNVDIYDFFGITPAQVESFTQKQINSVNSQMFGYFQIDETDPNKVDKLINAINNTKRKPKVDIIF
ncbi:MAG: hypothetical protein ACI31M_00800 [Bacilli bacterium]